EPGDKRHSTRRPSLIAEAGATNARFAEDSPAGRLQQPRMLAREGYPALHGAVAAHLKGDLPPPRLPQRESTALGIGWPVGGDRVGLTSHQGSFAIEQLRGDLSIERLHVLNDFTAAAAAMTQLEGDERTQVGGGEPLADAPIGVLGPGSGLGVGGAIPSAAG